MKYRRVPKFSDARNFAVIHPKFKQTPNPMVFCQKHANGIANSEDPDQTAPEEQSDLGLHCLPSPICRKT